MAVQRTGLKALRGFVSGKKRRGEQEVDVASVTVESRLK